MVVNMHKELEVLKPAEWWKDAENSRKWLDKQIGNRMKKAYFYTESIKEVVRQVGEADCESVLEVGSGDGRLIGALPEEFKDKKCCAVDISKTMAEYVKGKYPNLDVIVSDVCALPFKDGEFDLVFTFEVLQHVPPEKVDIAVAELRRVCKKEFWLWEGFWEKLHDGERKSFHNDGVYNYRFNRRTRGCYEMKIYKDEGFRLKLYKFKK